MENIKVAKATVVAVGVALVTMLLGLYLIPPAEGDVGEDEAAYKEYVFLDAIAEGTPLISLFTIDDFGQFSKVLPQLKAMRKDKALSDAMVVVVRGLKLQHYSLLLYDPTATSVPAEVDYPPPWRSLEFSEAGQGKLRVYLLRGGKGGKYFILKDRQFKPAVEVSASIDEWEMFGK